MSSKLLNVPHMLGNIWVWGYVVAAVAAARVVVVLAVALLLIKFNHITHISLFTVCYPIWLRGMARKCSYKACKCISMCGVCVCVCAGCIYVSVLVFSYFCSALVYMLADCQMGKITNLKINAFRILFIKLVYSCIVASLSLSLPLSLSYSLCYLSLFLTRPESWRQL